MTASEVLGGTPLGGALFPREAAAMQRLQAGLRSPETAVGADYTSSWLELSFENNRAEGGAEVRCDLADRNDLINHNSEVNLTP